MNGLSPTSLLAWFYERNWDKVFDSFFDEAKDPILDLKIIDRLGVLLSRLKMCDRESFDRSDTVCGMNLLHVLCRFQPPLDLIISVTRAWPHMVGEMDEHTGHFPLHVAALHGCTSSVMKHLLNEYGHSAQVPDKNDKLPLHLACRPIQWQFHVIEDDLIAVPKSIQAGSAVIRILCDHWPHASNVEDCDGCNPLEIAIENELSQKICQILLETSDRAWKIEKQNKLSQHLVTWKSQREKKCNSLQESLNTSSTKAQPQDNHESYHEARIDCITSKEDVAPWTIPLNLPPYSEMLLKYRAQVTKNNSHHLNVQNVDRRSIVCRKGIAAPIA